MAHRSVFHRLCQRRWKTSRAKLSTSVESFRVEVCSSPAVGWPRNQKPGALLQSLKTAAKQGVSEVEALL